MEKSTEKEWAERYKREQSEKSKEVFADLIFCSSWGIAIVFSFVIYSWQGWAEVYNQATPESTYFNYIAVVLLVAFSLIVTVIYIRFKSSRRRTN